MIKRTVSGYAACLMAIVPMAAITATSGCSGQAPEGDDDDHAANETAAVTNNGATDPGPRAGAAGAGAPLTPQPIDPDNTTSQAAEGVACFPGLQAGMKALCEEAFIRFQEIDSIAGATVSTGIPGFITKGTIESGTGVGPTFNNVGCAICHSQPGVGGAGVAPSSPQFPGVNNPQVAVATLDGATNTLPSFITATGPIREARFTTDGGVHGLFTIAGRTDAPGCDATQPPFATALAAGQVSFRIPISTFGDGLVENVTEAALAANLALGTSKTLGIAGTFNLSGNDGTITRFGWKAQNKSLTMFAGEAYNVEQGVSNLLFPDERNGGAGSLQGCFSFHPDAGGQHHPLDDERRRELGQRLRHQLGHVQLRAGDAALGAAGGLDGSDPRQRLRRQRARLVRQRRHAGFRRVRQHRLRQLPQPEPHHGHVELRSGDEQRRVPPLLGLRHPQHGHRSGRRHHPG
jgi:hypothetical protein